MCRDISVHWAPDVTIKPEKRPKVKSLTSRNNSRLCVDQRSDVVRVVLEGPGPEPLLVLLLHSGRHELELHDGPLRRPGNQAALILSNHFNGVSKRPAVSTSMSVQVQTD